MLSMRRMGSLPMGTNDVCGVVVMSQGGCKDPRYLLFSGLPPRYAPHLVVCSYLTVVNNMDSSVQAMAVGGK